jgi:hypothetical protein
MEKGYVYIGRLVDHTGNFVTNYYKIGLTVDLKTRETQLNSTHMPLDVVFIRMFETEHMSSLEKTLHVTFEDYRVEKEYEWRKNIKTEWFNVVDEEKFNSRLTKFIKSFPNTVEISEKIIEESIMNDTGQTINQKVELVNTIKESRKTLKIFMDNIEIPGDTIIDKIITFGNDISKIYNKDLLVEKLPTYFKTNREDLPQSMVEGNRNNYTILNNGLYFTTWGNVNQKRIMIETISKKLNITNVNCIIE